MGGGEKKALLVLLGPHTFYYPDLAASQCGGNTEGVIQQLCGQNFAIFLAASLSVLLLPV